MNHSAKFKYPKKTGIIANILQLLCDVLLCDVLLCDVLLCDVPIMCLCR